MKNVLILLCLVATLSTSCNAQKVSVDKDGNYHPLSSKAQDKPTGKVFIDDKGVSYPVYLNSKNKPYIIRKSKKTGKEYKAYLKV